jgi:hypothetical protein
MSILIEVDNPRDWPLSIPEVTVVPARTYLADPGHMAATATSGFSSCARLTATRSSAIMSSCLPKLAELQRS